MLRSIHLHGPWEYRVHGGQQHVAVAEVAGKVSANKFARRQQAVEPHAEGTLLTAPVLISLCDLHVCIRLCLRNYGTYLSFSVRLGQRPHSTCTSPTPLNRDSSRLSFYHRRHVSVITWASKFGANDVKLRRLWSGQHPWTCCNAGLHDAPNADIRDHASAAWPRGGPRRMCGHLPEMGLGIGHRV